MRGVCDLTCQILPREVQALVKVKTPFLAIGHVEHYTIMRDQFSRTMFAVAAFELQDRDEPVGDVHTMIILTIPGWVALPLRQDHGP